jgi:hypothetical protein
MPEGAVFILKKPLWERSQRRVKCVLKAEDVKNAKKIEKSNKAAAQSAKCRPESAILRSQAGARRKNTERIRLRKRVLGY